MIEPPSSPKAEATAAILKGAVSAVPIAGGLLAELGNLYLNPLERRKQEWMHEVSEAINQINAERDIQPITLENNEAFVSALYQATDVALRTHRSEKRAALRNALVSAATIEPAEDEYGATFIRYIDELSSTHVHMLQIINHRAGLFARLEKLEQVYSLATEITKTKLDRTFFRSVLQDLEMRFLLRLGDLEELPEYKSKQDLLVTDQSTIRPLQVTTLGRAFLAYIRADQL